MAYTTTLKYRPKISLSHGTTTGGKGGSKNLRKRAFFNTPLNDVYKYLSFVKWLIQSFSFQIQNTNTKNLIWKYKMIDTNADTVTWVDNGRIAHCCLLLPGQTYLSKCQVTVPCKKSWQWSILHQMMRVKNQSGSLLVPRSLKVQVCKGFNQVSWGQCTCPRNNKKEKSKPLLVRPISISCLRNLTAK